MKKKRIIPGQFHPSLLLFMEILEKLVLVCSNQTYQTTLDEGYSFPPLTPQYNNVCLVLAICCACVCPCVCARGCLYTSTQQTGEKTDTEHLNNRYTLTHAQTSVLTLTVINSGIETLKKSRSEWKPSHIFSSLKRSQTLQQADPTHTHTA